MKKDDIIGYIESMKTYNAVAAEEGGTVTEICFANGDSVDDFALIKTGILPPVIFMGVGALTDFGPMLRNLKLSLFGGAAQLDIFTVVILAVPMGYTLPEAASMGIIWLHG